MELIGKVQRWVKGKGQQLVVQPNVIKAYNEGMGGVDMMDRLLQSYRPGITMKKWWWSLFINIVNLSVLAAWRLYQKSNPGNKMPHFEFRSYITHVLIKSTDETRTKRERTMAKELPSEVKGDGSGHIVEQTSQGRCVICRKNTRLQCAKCVKRLHNDKGKDCFYLYHVDM